MRDGLFIFVSLKPIEVGNDDDADGGSWSTNGWNINVDCNNNTEQLPEGMICNLTYLSNVILFLFYLIK